MLKICSVNKCNQILTTNPREVGAVISIVDPGCEHWRNAQLTDPLSHILTLNLEFEDLVEGGRGTLANDDHIQQIIDVAPEMHRKCREEKKQWLVHCHAGMCRSPAAAFIAACACFPPGKEFDLIHQMMRSKSDIDPNMLMVDIADRLMDRKGKMVMALDSVQAIIAEKFENRWNLK